MIKRDRLGKIGCGGKSDYMNNNVPTQGYINQRAINQKKYNDLMQSQKGTGVKRRGRKMGGMWNPFSADSWKSLGDKNTWTDLGNKVKDAVLQPIQNVKNLAGAAKDALESAKDSDNWKNAITHPIDWSENQLKPWLKNNQVISSALGTFLPPGLGTAPATVLENGTRALGYGLKKKRTVKRKSIKRRGGQLYA